MREALARTDFDYSVRSPARKGGKGRGGVFGRLVDGARRTSLVTLIGAAFAAGAIAFVFNALVLQDAPHPSPLFAEPAAKAKSLPKEAPTPPARPATLAPPAAPPTTSPPPAVQAPAAEAPVKRAPKPAPPPAAEKPAPPRDVIGDLLKTGQPPAAEAPAGNATLASVQRALTRAGYDVGKADGVMGPATRQAIERFERERKLAVTGDVSPRLLKELGVAGRP